MVTSLPYTDEDLRAEATRQYAEVVSAPDLLEVGDEMRSRPVPSRSADESFRWGQLSDDDFHDARNEVHELLDDALDLSRWSVDLGACGLRKTTELAWGRGGDAWDLAVQIAHRPGLKPELHKALVDIVRGAVRLALNNHGITDQRLLRDAATEENAS